MSIPNSGGVWPPEFGGDFLPVDNGLGRGTASRAWLDQLRDDCPACTWWPDVRDGSKVGSRQFD